MKLRMIGTIDENGLAAKIRGLIEKNGPMTFAAFMELALYHPERGYYTSPVERQGPEGDYITSPLMSEAFSRTLAREVYGMWQALGRPGEFTLLEAGAGRGTLISGIFDTLSETSDEIASALRPVVVERGGPLGKFPPGTDFYRDIADAVPFEKGIILSNELIDSLPFHRVTVRDGELREIYVGLDEGRLSDVVGPPSTDELAAYFERLALKPVEGQMMEVSLEAGRWLETASNLFESGFILTIDYGLPARELFGPERQGGTLLCHRRHTINDDPYRDVGLQDITAHVDFTSLYLKGLDLGLELTGFTTQKNFLLGLGILECLEGAGREGPDPGEVARNRALAGLIAPGGAGDTFKVLVQHRGLELWPRLAGFSFRDMSHFLTGEPPDDLSKRKSREEG